MSHYHITEFEEKAIYRICNNIARMGRRGDVHNKFRVVYIYSNSWCEAWILRTRRWANMTRHGPECTFKCSQLFFLIQTTLDSLLFLWIRFVLGWMLQCFVCCWYDGDKKGLHVFVFRIYSHKQILYYFIIKRAFCFFTNANRISFQYVKNKYINLSPMITRSYLDRNPTIKSNYSHQARLDTTS